MENNSPIEQSQPTSPVSNKTFIANSIRFLVILAVISPLVYTNYVLRNKLEKYTSQETSSSTPSPAQSPTPTLATTPVITSTITPVETMPDQWQQAKYGGVFSYSYPSGWHVAEIWPQDNAGPIRLTMDTKPITTAPMGGPSSTFNINFYNGLPKPEAKLAELKAELKPEYFTDVKTETIESSNGPIFYHSGKMSGEYMNGTKVETYLFTIKKSNTDPQNVQVMQAMLYGGDQKQSEMLRHIVLSFKAL